MNNFRWKFNRKIYGYLIELWWRAYLAEVLCILCNVWYRHSAFNSPNQRKTVLWNYCVAHL